MKQIAFLEYGFMFDPHETFSNVFDFEAKLAEFFRKNGYRAHIIDQVRGQTGRQVILLEKLKEDVIEQAEERI